MIDPGKVCLFIPPNLKGFKQKLFDGIGEKIKAAGGTIIRSDYEAVKRLPDDVIPIVGVSPQFREQFAEWQGRGRNFIFWDRGYLRRVFATWLPNGNQLGVPGGFYRWTLNSFQMKEAREVPADRWLALKLQDQVRPWNKNGRHIVVIDTGFDYWDAFADRGWVQRTAAELRKYTDRAIVIRDKESKRPLYDELKEAHALVAHGSIAAVEAAIMGCPVFVHQYNAARFVGLTDFSKIESPIYPEREQWLCSLAYSQWNEKELVDGTLWKQIS